MEKIDERTESKLFSTSSFEFSCVSGSGENVSPGAKNTTYTNSPSVWRVLSICSHLGCCFGKNHIYQASSLFVRSSRISSSDAAHLLLSLDTEFNGMALASVPLVFFVKYSDNPLIDSADHCWIIEVFWSIQIVVISASGRNEGKDETTQR